jgi:hypothetical protein
MTFFTSQDSTRLTQVQFEELWTELKCINWWDRAYDAQEVHDSMENDAWKARRQRKREILEKLNEPPIAVGTDRTVDP